MILKLHKLIDFIAYWWHRATSSRYVLHLERENKRLLQENANLHATIYGIRGLPGQPAPVPGQGPGGDVPIAVRDAQQQPPGQPRLVRSRSRSSQESVRETVKAIQTAQRDKLADLHNKLQEAIKEEKEQERGAGYVITERGADPVRVEEPEVVLEEESDAQSG